MQWDKDSIHEVVKSQRAFFRSGRTLSVEWRKRQLRRLNAAMKKYESEIMDALHLARNSYYKYKKKVSEEFEKEKAIEKDALNLL